MRRIRKAAGFTLIELMVVVLLVGVLAAFAVPQYMKSLENSKADDGSALMNMVGTTNRMYALDHGGTYTSGQLVTTCSASTCAGLLTDPCQLVGCKYLAAQDFDKKAYIVFSADGTTSASCQGFAAAKDVACAKRRSGAPPGTSNATYQGWGYTMDVTGAMTAQGGAPTPVQ